MAFIALFLILFVIIAASPRAYKFATENKLTVWVVNVLKKTRFTAFVLKVLIAALDPMIRGLQAVVRCVTCRKKEAVV